MSKKWFLITYGVTVINGPLSKWLGKELLFSETDEDSLIKNTVKYLNDLHKPREVVPFVKFIESLNEDGTKSEVLRGFVGSKIYKACSEFSKL
jgi:hypothetical protein